MAGWPEDQAKGQGDERQGLGQQDGVRVQIPVAVAEQATRTSGCSCQGDASELEISWFSRRGPVAAVLNAERLDCTGLRGPGPPHHPEDVLARQKNGFPVGS